MVVAILGAAGMLGVDTTTILKRISTVYAVDIQDIDITNATSIQTLDAVDSLSTIINCAAYTRVDDAESNYEPAYRINAVGPALLAEYCRRRNLHLIHFSTDYVFPGSGVIPYTESDSVGPLSVYGTTKLEGERLIQASGCHYNIIRLQWLYGANGPNFIDTMTQLLTIKNTVSVVNDQWGSPTWTMDVANVLQRLLLSPIPSGIYHLAPSGFASWYDVACEIKKRLNLAAEIVPVTSDYYPRPAQRPLNSRLDCSLLRSFGVEIPGLWDSRLAEYLSGT